MDELPAVALPAAANTALDRLRQRGHRGTPARRYILQQLATGSRHHTADELFTSRPAALLDCDRSTIHRQLIQLQQAGVIHAIPAARAVTYGLPRDSPHHHESCLTCGLTMDSPPGSRQADEPVPSLLPQVHTTVSLGTCHDCSPEVRTDL